MNKFYPRYEMIAALMGGRDKLAAAQAAMNAIARAAGNRQVVLPEMRGGFLPHVVRESGAETLPWPEFKAARADVAQAGRLGRMGLAAPAEEGHRKVVDLAAKRAYLARRDARRRELADACRARKGSAGGGGGKKGKKAA